MSGHPDYNVHANDIDFQIESDFIGLMCPGLPRASNHYADRVGRVMNYGDGLYGGMLFGAMYAAAFFETDPHRVVEQGLLAIPAESGYARLVRDVLAWHAQDPADWRKNWRRIEEKWNRGDPCPDGALAPFNIDARVNGAYVVIGLLYGGGDFGRTLEIAARCGQDSDCNPASAGGILGTMLGYEGIPPVWRDPVKAIEDRPFPFTALSLEKVYATGLEQALEMVRRNGGTVEGETVRLPVQAVRAVPLEVSFEGCHPVGRRRLGLRLETSAEIAFEGTGYVLTGGPSKMAEAGKDPYVYKIEVGLDDRAPVVVAMPVDELVRRLEVAWGYKLAQGRHTLKLSLLNPRPDEYIRIDDLIAYGDRPAARPY
jgi:hypothetical protein